MTENNQKKRKEQRVRPVSYAYTQRDSREIQEINKKKRVRTGRKRNEKGTGKKKKSHACVHRDGRSFVVIASSR